MAKIRTQRHIIREKARKRTKSLFRKANELAQVTDANVYLVIDRNGKFQVYRSTDRPGWPPSEERMVQDKQGPAVRFKGPTDFEPTKGGKRNQGKSGHRSGTEPPKSELEEDRRAVVQRQHVFWVPNPPNLPDL